MTHLGEGEICLKPCCVACVQEAVGGQWYCQKYGRAAGCACQQDDVLLRWGKFFPSLRLAVLFVLQHNDGAEGFHVAMLLKTPVIPE